MANLVELSNQLEDFPEQQLVQMSQDPNSMYPSYLVLSEIQRRNQMRKMYEAQQPKPETTVAEEVIGEFAGQQGLQGAMAQSPGPQDAFPPSDMGNMAPPSPMQMMASGGIVGYKNKGKTEYKEAADDYGKQLQEIFEKEGRYKKRYSDYEKGERFTYPLTPRDYVVSDEEYSRLKKGDYVMGEGDLQDYRPFLMLLNALDGESGARYMPESEVKGLKAKLKASIMEDKLSQMGMASGGRTGYNLGGSLGIGGDSLSQTFTNPTPSGTELVSDTFTSTVENEPGFFSNAINWAKENPADALSMAANATFFIPGIGVVAGAAIKGGAKLLPVIANAAKKAAPVIKKGLQQTYTKKNPALQGGLKTGQRKVIDPKTQTSKMIDNTTGKVIPERVFSGKRTALAAFPLTGTAMNLTQLALSPDEEINPATVQTQTDDSKDKVVNDLITSNINADKGLGQKFKDFANSSRGADMLVGLGGAIGSAKNLGELSSNISDAYFGVQSKRDAKDLAGLQGRLIEAQINKYEADVANMPLDVAIKQYQSLNDLVDSGVLTADEAKIREAALMQRIQRLQGITVAEKDKRDELLGLVQEVG